MHSKTWKGSSRLRWFTPSVTLLVVSFSSGNLNFARNSAIIFESTFSIFSKDTLTMLFSLEPKTLWTRSSDFLLKSIKSSTALKDFFANYSSLSIWNPVSKINSIHFAYNFASFGSTRRSQEHKRERSSTLSCTIKILSSSDFVYMPASRTS